MRGFTFLIFAVLTFCCWGLYGPLLHVGQDLMGHAGKKASLKPFMGVGLAYFVIAVIFPLLVLYTRNEKGRWTAGGFFWSFLAGIVGAVGALGIILAFKFEGKPVYVMPLVFGLAPVVNTLVTMSMARTFRNISLRFILGVVIAATGAAGVLTFKPKAEKPAATESGDMTGEASGDETGSTSNDNSGDDVVAAEPEKQSGGPNLLMISLSVIITAICWGSYGAVLHKGQAKMDGSRLRPFLCVGLAYFAIAVVLPYFLLFQFPEAVSDKPATGLMWSMFAGAAGALGALGIIYAFNFGGKPVYIMPIVFGFAPVVNTLTETWTRNLFGRISWPFYLSLGLVILGAMMVLIFAPRGGKPAAATSPTNSE